MIRQWLGCGVAAVGVGLVAVPAASAKAAQPTCGSTITKSVKLTADVSCPLGTKTPTLTIGANGVTLNLNGHSVSSNSDIAVVDDGYSGVTILNGQFLGFGEGSINLTNADRVRIEDVFAYEVSSISGGERDSISGSELDGNGDSLNVGDSNGLTITRTTFDGQSGMTTISGNDDVVKNNVFKSGPNGGLTVTGSGDLVKANVIPVLDANGGDGNELIGNTLDGGGGISVAASASETLVKANTVTDSYDTGITVLDPTAQIIGNTSDDNFGYGIDATAGDTGRHNEASGNSDAGQGGSQCINIVCTGS